MKKKILISTGGSGGHVVPATILYEHLKDQFHVSISSDYRGMKFLDKNKYNLDIFNITITFVQIWRLPRSRDLGRACHLPPDSLVNLIALGGAIGRVKCLLYLAPNAKKVLIGYSLKIIGLSPIHSYIFMLSCGG